MQDLFIGILASFFGMWALILVIIIIANIRGHRLENRTLTESLIIEMAAWFLGALIFTSMVPPVWGYIIPSIEKQGVGQSGPDFRDLSCLIGGCPTSTTPSPNTSPTNNDPLPTPTSGDQLVRDHSTNNTVRCLITADTGDSGGANIVNLANNLGASCLLIAGDVIYPNGSLDNFNSVVKSYLDPWIQSQSVYVGPGNHDWWRGYPDQLSLSWTADELPLCQAFPYLPTGQGKCRYYRVLLSPEVEIFFFDSDYREPDGNSASSTQGKWLQAALSSSTATWKIVLTHEPPISSCNHDANSAISGLPLKEWGADALFTGHCHHYERSDWNGLPVFVVGNGGNSIYQFERVNPYSKFRWNQTQGAVMMTASPTQLIFDFTTTNGEVKDSLQLSK